MSVRVPLPAIRRSCRLGTFLLACAGATAIVGARAALARETVPLDRDWRFLKADAPGAEAVGFDDAVWRTLDVPHDWGIEGPFDKANPAGRPGGYLPGGVGWYRKHFALPPQDSGRRVFVAFDGVMANSEVWINGVRLGQRPYGYVGFQYELTGHLTFGDRTNVIAVRADDAQQPASRWYSGAGLYRHVRLVVTDPVHLEQDGVFVTTPQVDKDRAAVHVKAAVVNQSDAARDIAVDVRVRGPDGREMPAVAAPQQKIAAGQTATFEQDVTVPTPALWDVDHPNLYVATTRVRVGTDVPDETQTTFGIRSVRFDADTGFWLNGRNFKLNGVCLHHDASALGAAVPLRAWERRLELLRGVGANAIRTSHNPVAPEFLDLCDRMGFLVMDEMFDGWTRGKTRFDYHLFFDQWATIDTRDTVRRDRNHPCVVLYSTGNEVRDTADPALAKRVLGSLLTAFHDADPTRPVTQGIFRPNATHDYDNGFADLLDVVGQNYRENELAAAHRQKPTRKIIGTENAHALNAWLACRDNPAMAGQFLWTGFDYLGESAGWPAFAFPYGLFDRVGTPRPRAFQRQSWWTARPMVYAARRVAPDATQPTDPGYGQDRGGQALFPDWTPRLQAKHDETLEVYSNCPQVELLLNGRSLGSQDRPPNDAPRVWTVPFEAGTLRAIARADGKVVATHELKTAGPAARIVLSADRPTLTPDWDDVCYVEARVVDADGTLVPDASDVITFDTSGDGGVVAVDSGNNADHEPFQANRRAAYQGRCVAIMRARGTGGELVVRAAAAGLSSEPVSIRLRAAAGE